ncbi:hypothetical protein [Microbacterium lemovicicum]|uniref:hypothetical protein n=1 Tax=Microbacterium lemovicicum TaxID=1072463 RepID=UPI000F8E94CE|nr:hypothetical protein [Microbacterium lemovicicum]
MVDARYRLVWPKPLFTWEAQRVLALPEEMTFAATERLLAEAFSDESVLLAYRNLFVAWRVQDDDYHLNLRSWLMDLVADDARLLPYVLPRYYAEREGHSARPDQSVGGLGVQFATLLRQMQEDGYFPLALPRDCVDHPTDWYEVGDRVRQAVLIDFRWDGQRDQADAWGRPLLFSLIEYFHDNAQRPRTVGYIHDHGDCGPHYADHDAESGEAVYRWRVNELLDRHRVDLNLGRAGDERGRLVHRFGTPLDDAADRRAAQEADDPDDEVAHAIRDFRARGASATQKRGALVLLAGALEARRQEVKVVLGKDEGVLFRLANEFGLRHRNDRQRMDYGDEFLDYMFSAYLAAVMLMEALERRRDGQTAATQSNVP